MALLSTLPQRSSLVIGFGGFLLLPPAWGVSRIVIERKKFGLPPIFEICSQHLISVVVETGPQTPADLTRNLTYQLELPPPAGGHNSATPEFLRGLSRVRGYRGETSLSLPPRTLYARLSLEHSCPYAFSLLTLQQCL